MDKQWVNLPKEKRFVDDETGAVERLGEVNFKAELERSGVSAVFKTRIDPEKEAAYSDSERGRNQRFKVLGARGTHSQDQKEIEYDAPVHLPAAGGNVYKITALSAAGAEVGSKTIETWRRLYLQSIAMDGISPGETPVDDFAKQFLSIVKKPDGANIKARKVVSDDNRAAFLYDVRRSYSIKDIDPFGLAVVWVDMIANKGEQTFWAPVAKGSNADTSVTFKAEWPLWYKIDDQSPREVGEYDWVVSASYAYRHPGGPKPYFTVDVPHERMSVVLPSSGPAVRFRVKLSEHPPPAGAELMGVRCKVRVCLGTPVGKSLNRANVILISHRNLANNKENGAAAKKHAFLHELGHKIGLTPNGRGKALDKTPEHYDEHGHNGDHCKKNVKWNAVAKQWEPDPLPSVPEPRDRDPTYPATSAPICAMHGNETARHPTNRYAHFRASDEYCADCRASVQRLDLGTGMPGFEHLVSKMNNVKR